MTETLEIHSDGKRRPLGGLEFSVKTESVKIQGNATREILESMREDGSFDLEMARPALLDKYAGFANQREAVERLYQTADRKPAEGRIKSVRYGSYGTTFFGMGPVILGDGIDLSIGDYINLGKPEAVIEEITRKISPSLNG